MKMLYLYLTFDNVVHKHQNEIPLSLNPTVIIIYES